MNRIQYLVDDEQTASSLSHASVALAAEESLETDQAHCIFTPLHYERNYAYPLIVWLHGPDDDERQVNQIMPHVSMRNYVAVGPRGTLPSLRAPNAYGWSQRSAHIQRAEQRILSAVAVARRWLNISPERIYLAGLGCGGTMAFRVALAQPQLFAGVLSIGGAFPSTLCPLSQLHAARRLKIFLASSRDSSEYPAEDVCRNLRLFHSAGMSVCLRQYPCGDEVRTNMLSDMDHWIMEQLTSSVPATPQDEPSGRQSRK